MKNIAKNIRITRKKKKKKEGGRKIKDVAILLFD